MTFHGSNRSFEHNARKRNHPHSDATNQIIIGDPGRPLTFQSTTCNLPTYRSSAIPLLDATDSQSDCPFHFATSSTTHSNSVPLSLTKNRTTKRVKNSKKQSISTIDPLAIIRSPPPRSLPDASSLMKDASIDVSQSTFSAMSSNHIRRNYRNYRNRRDAQERQRELWELCKWCFLCLAALGSCVVLVPYLIDTASSHWTLPLSPLSSRSPSSSSSSSSRTNHGNTNNYNNHNVPHHSHSNVESHFISPSLVKTHRKAKIQGSIAHSYLTSDSKQEIQFRSQSQSQSHSNSRRSRSRSRSQSTDSSGSHSYHHHQGSMPNPKTSPMNPIAMDAVIGRIRNIKLNGNAVVNVDGEEIESVDSDPNHHPMDYHLVRHDKYSILGEILFIVTLSSDNGVSMTSIKSTWGRPLKGRYMVTIKFLRCGSTGNNPISNEDDNGNDVLISDNPYNRNNPIHSNFEGDDVITAPLDLDAGGCLLWAIDQYSDGYRWVFKLDDTNFVMMDNTVDYLNQIELESSVSMLNHKDGYHWWLGNAVNDDHAGYLLNRVVLDVLKDEIREYHHSDNGYVMCQDQDKLPQITSEYECMEYVLTLKHGVHPTSTLDKEGNEKFSASNPLEMIESVGMDHLSKTPITFGHVTPEWMDAYYQLLYLHRDSKEIEMIAKQPDEWMDSLRDYAQIVTHYSLTNHIKDTRHEMQRVKTQSINALVK